MKKIKLIAIFCILLIINLPVVYSATDSFATASERAGADPLYGGSLGGYTYTQDPYAEQIRKATGGFSPGLEQYLGEAIITYVADYQPRQLRESELEQADRPVYVFLKGTHTGQLLSPFTNDPSAKDPLSGLTNIPPIDRIEVFPNKTSDYSKYIRFVNYIPPRADRPSLNNLGTAIVMVRKLPTANETIKDNTIILDMNARIFLKLQESNLLGISQQDLVLKQIPNRDEFIKNKDEYSFFTGKGYIQATKIDSNSVTLQVFNRDLYPISLYNPASSPAAAGLQPGAVITLTKGQTSPPLSFRYSGNPLSDMFQIRLEEVSTPTDKAEIEFQLDGRTTTRKIGVGRELYAGSKWILNSATKEDTPRKITKDNFNSELPKIAKEFKLNVQAQNQISKKISDGTNFIVKNHIIILENKFTGETKEITREVVLEETGNPLAVDISPISSEMADLIEDSYCEENVNVPDDDYACTAIKKYKELIEKYLTSPEVTKAKKDLAEIYDSASIEFKPCLDLQTSNSAADQKALDSCYQFQQDMLELAFYYYSQIGEQSKIKNKYGGKGGDGFLEDEGIPLKLLKVITKDEEKGTASVRLYEETGKYSEDKKSENDFFDFEVNYKGNKNYRWRIDSLYPTSLTLRLYEVPNPNDKTCKDCKATSEQITLKLNEQKDVPIGYPETNIEGQPKQLQKNKALMVTQIESKSEAYITILPGAGRGFVTSSFRIHIPIDPRPFKWTPEQLESQIKSTKEIIKKLDEIITKIDKFVTSMKKICLGVFAFLTIKNSFTGIRNIARRQVSEAYKERCQTEVAEGKTDKHEEFRRLEICLGHYSAEMSSAIDVTEKHMREINSKIEKRTADEIEDNIASNNEQELCGKYEKFYTASKTLGTRNQDIIKQYRDCLLSAKIQSDPTLNEQVKNSFSKKFDEINTKKTTDIYDEAWNIAKGSNGKWNPNNSTDIKSIINQIEFDKQKGKEQSESNTVQIKLTNTQAGEWTGETLLQDKEGYKSTTLKGLSKYEFIVYENELTDKEKVNKYICEKELSGEWENNGRAVCEKNSKDITSLLSEKIKQLKIQPAQEGTNQKFVTQEFYTQTYEVENGILKSAIPKPVYYSSSSALDTAGRQINTEYSSLQLTAYYDKDGLPYCYPVGKGNYVYVLERFSGPSQEINLFKVMNVGPNGRIECNSGDDENVYLPEELNIKVQEKKNFLNKEPKVKCKDPGKTQVSTIDNKPVICQKGDQAFGLSSLVKPQCTDVMDPADCKIMFNFCDPVMCPSSRCTLGGRVSERNVIQSGVIGSTVLCLPNIKQGIVLPVCLTGISAGLKGIKSILEGYQFCLETNLKEGKNVGLCDYIRSVGICEVVWKEAYNLLDIGGKGLIDWVTGAIETKGGGEYLQFQTSLQNVGDSVRTFTEEYKTTYTAQFLSQTTEEIGSQICRLSVNGKLPSVGKILDQLTEPENPPQFTAFFDISPYATPGETPPVTSTIPGGTQEISRYKVFYHIYAGTGFYQGSYSQPVSLFNPQTQLGQPQPMTYSVYLINKELGLPPLYVTFPDDNLFQQPGRLDQNKFVQQTVQKIGAKGYNQICVNINGIENCGFQRVSSSFGLREMQDALTGDEASKKIDSADKCVPSSKSSPQYSVAKLGALATTQLAAGASGLGIFQPQPGAVGTGVVTSGIEEGLFSTGIVRLCAIEPPTTETGRWKEVGTCGKDERDKTLGKCWLDLKSVSIEDRKFNEEFLRELRERANPNIQLIEAEKAKQILFSLNKERNTLLDEIRAAVAAAKKGEAPEVTRIFAAKSIAPAERILTATSKQKRKLEQSLISYIEQVSQSYNIDSLFVRAVIKAESDWSPFVISCAGAAGLMQLMPHTANDRGLKVINEVPNTEIKYCIDNLGSCEQKVNGDGKCVKKDGKKLDNDYAEELTKYVNGKVIEGKVNELIAEDERFDNEKAIKATITYFVQDIKNTLEKNNIALTLENVAAAYNMGPAALVQNKGKPYQETKENYVNKIISYYNTLLAEQGSLSSQNTSKTIVIE